MLVVFTYWDKLYWNLAVSGKFSGIEINSSAFANKPYNRVHYNTPEFVCLFVSSLFFCHEKATVALYFGRIRTRLGVVDFRVFRLFLWLLTLNLLLVRSHLAEIIIVKCLSKGTTTCATRVGVKPRSRYHDHTVAVKAPRPLPTSEFLLWLWWKTKPDLEILMCLTNIQFCIQ